MAFVQIWRWYLGEWSRQVPIVTNLRSYHRLGVIVHLILLWWYRCSSPRLIVDEVFLPFAKGLELRLFIQGERLTASEWHHDMPQTKSSSVVRIIEDQLVSNPWALPPWGILVKWVPIIHGWHFKVVHEHEKEEEGGLPKTRLQLVSGSIHIAVDIEQEDHVEDCDVAGEVLDA